jgi:hypothetical protein
MSREVQHSGAVSRLLGDWKAKDGEDLLCFVHVDTVSLTGTYVYFPQGHPPGRRVRFKVLHEDPKRERLIIKRWDGDLTRAEHNTLGRTRASDATIYIPTGGRSLTWINVEAGNPVLTVYNQVIDTQGKIKPRRAPGQ